MKRSRILAGLMLACASPMADAFTVGSSNKLHNSPRGMVCYKKRIPAPLSYCQGRYSHTVQVQHEPLGCSTKARKQHRLGRLHSLVKRMGEDNDDGVVRYGTGTGGSSESVEKNNNNNSAAAEEYKIRDKDFLERTKHWVVIVDDEEPIRLAVGDYLYDRGYQVTACADADALLEICARPRSEGELPAVPDAIVSDIRMPGKDGLELLGLIRADERLSRVPVILLTAKSMTKDRIEGYRAGADAYLPKPFHPEELLSMLDNAIRRRKQMTGDSGKLVDLKEDMSNIKQMLRANGRKVVRATNVYLTPAELEVLELLCKGYSNGEIAAERGVNVIGVNRTISNLYLKTQTRTRTELVRWAVKTGHVAPR